MHWNRFHDARRFLRIDRVVNHFRRWFHERDWNVPLHQQVDRFDLAPRIVGINQKLFEALNLFLQMIETNGDLGVILVGYHQAIAFGSIDLANLKTRLHEASRRSNATIPGPLSLQPTEQFSPARAIRWCNR